METTLNDYFDITSSDLTDLSIQKKDQFSCQLVHTNGTIYQGFLLSNSEKGTNYTVCDVNFHPNEGKFQPRLTFRRTNKELQDTKVRNDIFFQRISFQKGDDGYKEFWKMIGFLYGFKEFVDIGEFTETFKIIETEDFIVGFKDKEEAEKIIDISKIVQSASLGIEKLETLSKNLIHEYRKQSLDIFKLMLENDSSSGKTYIEYYKDIHGLIELGEEVAWHHFLKTNPWIIGLNIDLRFIRDIISEGNVGIQNTDGKGSPNVDLIGLSDYTGLIELKTANKDIFTKTKKSTTRAGTWSFSDDFIDGISQCLAQNSSWEKSHESKNLIKNGEVIDQRAVRTLDPECIFIIGNKNREIPESSKDIDIINKRDTFQRFRMNSKNVKIITFDELYERALNIVNY